MLSKGHHFPHVTLALIADADLGLNLPDYRAAERTFQLLLQSAGRAGRGARPGKVLIQTRDTRHYCWPFVRNADYEGFYRQEIALRQKRNYPPFVKLALIRFAFDAEWENGPALLNSFSAALRETGRARGIAVLGPAPAPLARLRGKLRFQCLLKAGDWQSLRAVYAQTARKALPPHPPGELRVSLDLDPVNML
jgi:primosomal protein N' (replication factor Y)